MGHTLHYKMTLAKPKMDREKDCSPVMDTDTLRFRGDTSTETDSCQR